MRQKGFNGKFMGCCMKGLTIQFGWFAILLSFYLGAEQIQFKMRGQAGILINAETGAILFEEDAYSLQYPASTTKVATALFALHKAGNHLDMPITAESDALGSVTQEAKRKSNYTLPAYWQEPDGTHMGIKKGGNLNIAHFIGRNDGCFRQ